MTDKALEIGLDAAGGMLSGGVMAIPGAVGMRSSANRATNGVQYWSESQVRDLIRQGKEFGQGTMSYRLAEELEAKIDAGREVSRTDVGYLITATENAAAGAPENVPKMDTSENGQKNNALEGVRESTAVNTDPEDHTAAERRVIAEYQAAVDDRLKAMFTGYLDGSNQKFTRQNITPVGERQSADASRLLGGDYSGYTNAINSNGVHHILNEHGPNGTTDHSMKDLNDVARLGYVLDNYDNVELVTYKSGDADYSAEFRDKNNRPAPMLKYSKKVNGTYYVVEAVPESQFKKFWVTSAYMQTDGGTQAPNANGPRNTSDTSLASSPSVDSTLSQSAESVNPAPRTIQERWAALEAREEGLRARTQEYQEALGRGEDVSGLEAELMTEADAIEEERRAIRRAEDEEHAARVMEIKTLPTAEQLEERKRRTGNLRELERSGREAGATEEQIAVARRLADALGRRIVFFSAERSRTRGYYEEGTIYVNAAWGDEVGQIIAHELTHSIEGSESYGEFSRLVQRRIMETGGDLEGMLQEIRERYADAGIELDSNSDTDMKELVAEYVEKELLTDPESITSLVRESRSLGRRILDILDNLLAKITRREAAKERAFVRRARDLYAQALQDTRSDANAEAALQQLRTAYANGEITEEEFDRIFDALGVGIDEPGTQFSVAATDRREVAGRLRSMLNSGASVQELRRYVNSVSGTGTRQSPGGTRTDGAGSILAAAHRSNMSVDEYLRQNWDEYELDGQLRPEARRALEMEGRRQYSIKRDVNNREFVEIDRDILAGVPKSQWIKTVINNLNQRFPNGLTVRNDQIKINNQTTGEITQSKYSKALRNKQATVYADKLRATDNLDEIVFASRNWKGEGLKHPRKDNIREFARGEVLLKIGPNDYEAEVVVATTKSGDMVLYDMVSLAPTQIKQISISPTAATTDGDVNISHRLPERGSTDTVTQDDSDVNRQFSIAPSDSDTDTETDIRDAVPAKAKGYLEQAERGLVNKVGELMQVPRFARRDYLRGIAQEISREYLSRGTVSQEVRDRLFETAWEQGVEDIAAKRPKGTKPGRCALEKRLKLNFLTDCMPRAIRRGAVIIFTLSAV